MSDHQNHIDEFESMFRAAEREAFVYAEIPIRSATLVTDRGVAEAESVKSELLSFLPRLQTIESWRLITGDEFSNVAQLLERIEQQQNDLVVTSRHLQEESLVPQHSLGVYLDVLTQVATYPVLVLPGAAAHPVSLKDRVCNRVMVVADHISGDNGLINYGVRVCPSGGTVWFCHVEDDAVFNRYMNAIERISEIETEQARRRIEEQLLKEAGDFIETCITEIRANGPNVACRSSVTRGHHLRQYRELIDSHDIDLLVANTKDEDQLAMHGMTYSLSVELSDIPMLLL